MMHAVCIADRDGAGRNTVSRVSITGKERTAGLLRHWRIKKQIHIQAMSRIYMVMPVTDITMEMGNFDTQVLKAQEEGKPLPQGVDYQRGERDTVSQR